MPATVRNLQFTDEDFTERLSYDDLEVGDYVALLTDVVDVEAASGNIGWGFVFNVQGLPLTMKVWLKGGGKWKVREVFNALGQPIEPTTDVTTLDPNPLVGRSAIVTVTKETNDETGKTYTNIDRAVPLQGTPEAEAVNFSDLEVTTEDQAVEVL